ncbi:MAG: glycosyltransferase family 4 protein [Dehalococcoidales bacterium]|nr:glycosyltransferase family 4 protein [Dehalococcoidales bacterium]
MKIALVSPYDFSYPGGVVNHILALEKQLTGMGHDVRIIAPTSKEVTSENSRYLNIGKARPVPTRGTTTRIAISLHLAPQIKEVLEREKFDIIHLHEPFMPMLCSAVLRFSHTVNIGTFHAATNRVGYNWGWPVSTLMLKRRSRKVMGRIAVSKTAMEYAQKHVPGDYTIIPNGIDLDHFNPDVKPIEKYCDGKLNILFVGRLEKRKGVKYLLKAYQQIKEEFPDSRLIITGPGTVLRDRFERDVKKNCVQDVVFLGNIPLEDLPRYYKTADVFCAPAIGQESFGIILLEAMAVGTPIIATNIDGYASVLTNGREGLLVPPKNDIELANALRKILSDKTLRSEMGARGILTSHEYDWRKVARRINDFYLEIFNRQTKPEWPVNY